MKQIIQNSKSGEISVLDIPKPICQDNGIIVNTAYSVISAGTERTSVSTAKSSLIGKAKSRPDLVEKVIKNVKDVGLKKTYELVRDRLESPMALGYSLAGTVVEVGKNVNDIKIGDRVACGGGGYASHASVNYVPKNLVVKINDDVSFDEACYTTIGSIAMQGIRQSKATIGDTVAVIGLGLVGQLTSQILKASGCKVIGLDISEFPLKTALSNKLFSIDYGFNINEIDVNKTFDTITNGRGVDCVIITAASDTNKPLLIAGDILRDRGCMVIVGSIQISIPRSPFYEKEIDIKFSRSYGPGRYDSTYEEYGIDYPIGYVRWTERRDMESFQELISRKKISPKSLTTHTYEFDNASEAFNTLVEKKENYLGILLRYPRLKDAQDEKIIFSNKVQQNKLNKNIKVGFIGLGNFAQTFLMPPLIKQKNVYLHSICNNSGMSSEHMMKKFNFNSCTTNTTSLINNNDCNTIFIASRHDSHSKYLIDAIKKKKNIFIEKPIAINENEFTEVKKSLKLIKNNIMMVGYNRRFAPASIKMKKLMGDYNEPMSIHYRINAGAVPLNHWIQDPNIGGGRILGEVCHFVDYLLFLTNSKITYVYASALNSKNINTHGNDTLHIILSFKDGSIATIQYLANGSRKIEKEYIEVFTGGDSYTINDFNYGIAYKNNKKIKFYSGMKDKGHSKQIDVFINSIIKQNNQPISLNQIIDGMNVTFKIISSIKTQKVIKV